MHHPNFAFVNKCLKVFNNCYDLPAIISQVEQLIKAYDLKYSIQDIIETRTTELGQETTLNIQKILA